MKLIIKPYLPTPIYEQIATEIETQIMAEMLKAGQALPSIRALANELKVSVITTKKAYEVLERKELIIVLPQRGAFVADPKRSKLRLEAETELVQKCQLLLDEAKSMGMTKMEFLSLLKKTLED